MQLPKFTMGIGDRFGHQGPAQLQAFIAARADGMALCPVWNKSNREHLTVDTTPDSVRREADEAVKAAGWTHPYFVDADHINLKTVDRFVASADFFTIDVGDAIGGACAAGDAEAFAARHGGALKALDLGTCKTAAVPDRGTVTAIARKYLPAVKQAADTYRHIVRERGNADFVTEVSMDETDTPQTPLELFLILAALADEGVPLQTIAPKFSGRFNKGVDYVGEFDAFAVEFEADVCAVAAAVKAFGLPATLKLSIHSGSDKFSLYASVAGTLRRHGAGVHLKTAGTTWLAEVEGLIQSGSEGLALAKELYAEALDHFDELCAPYATVLDVRRAALPAPETVARWDADAFLGALAHTRNDARFNPDLRQLVHVAYKLAARKGPRYFRLLEQNRAIVGQRVTANLDRHIRLLFGAIGG